MILLNWLNRCNLIDKSKLRIKRTSGSLIIGLPPEYYSGIATCNDYITASNSSGFYLEKVGIALGSGTTQPTKEDYKIETPITTLTSNGAGNNIRQSGVYLSDYIITATQNVVNNTSNTITISEIGLFIGNSSGCILLTRDVIAPVTLAVGESKTFILSVDFEQLSTSAQS